MMMIVNTSSRLRITKAIAAHQQRRTICAAVATRCCKTNGSILTGIASPLTSLTTSSSSSPFSSVAYQDTTIGSNISSSTSPSSSWVARWTKKKNDDNVDGDGKTADGTIETQTNTMIRTIQEFIDQIPDAVHQRKIEQIEPGAENDPVARLFRRSDLPTDAWMKYALFDDTKPYTRNLISTDNETYTLLLLCWNPQQESPIHDHPCDGCWLQVLSGGIREVRYDKQLQRVAEFSYSVDNADDDDDDDDDESSSSTPLSYITDNIGYHKVGNTGTKNAVTLHLYAPPFETCQCWYSDTANPLEPHEGKNINHSAYGRVIHQ